MKDELPIRELTRNELRLLRFSKSGQMTPLLVALLCLGLLIAAGLRGHGNVHKLVDVVHSELKEQPDEDPAAPAVGPGGQNPIKLTRSVTDIGKDVEFLSATLLPGRGMSLLQITALVPGHGEVSLLVAPDVDSVNNKLTGTNDDVHGELSMTMGGAFLLPWAGRLTGTEAGRAGVLSTQWHGLPLNFPALAPGNSNPTASDPNGAAGGPNSAASGLVSTDGLFLNLASDTVKSDVLPDGQFAQGVFHAGSFQGNWPSTVDVTVTVEMSARTLDLTISATNTGKVATPFGTGWHPLFAIPSGNRGDATLSIPSNTMLDINRKSGIPSGRTLSTQATPFDFNRAHGARLGSQDIDAVYTQLQTSPNASHPVAELRDSGSNLTVRIIPLSSNITNLHVIAPSDKKWVSIDPATNLPDALGPEWKAQDGGLTTLAPGETTQWKVRIEIAPVDAEQEHSH